MHLNKNFILKLLALLLFLFLADRLGGKVLFSLFSNTKYNKSHQINYIINEVESEVLIFGSSRASHHYVPSILSDSLNLSVYNCGSDGQCIYYHYCLLDMIKNRYLPEVIILDLFYSEFYESANATLENIKDLNPLYDKNKDLKTFIDSISPFEKYKMFSKLYRYNTKLVDIIGDNFVKADHNWENGYIPIFDELTTSNMLTEPKRNNIDDEIKVSYLEKFISFCKENDIKLFLCVSPVYYKCVTYNSFTAAEKLAKKHDITLIDHYCDSSFTNINSYFKDEMHLNHNGAIKFSSIIGGEIKSYLKE